MMTIKTLYNDIGATMKGVCDKIYPKNRPSSVDTKINSYIVVRLPSGIYNQEIGYGYNDFVTTAQIEVYVRNKTTSKSPNGFDVTTTSDKVQEVLDKFPIATDNITVTRPVITFQSDDGDGFDVTIIQGTLRTK